jgi:hypothetical protein
MLIKLTEKEVPAIKIVEKFYRVVYPTIQNFEYTISDQIVNMYPNDIRDKIIALCYLVRNLSKKIESGASLNLEYELDDSIILSGYHSIQNYLLTIGEADRYNLRFILELARYIPNKCEKEINLLRSCDDYSDMFQHFDEYFSDYGKSDVYNYKKYAFMKNVDFFNNKVSPLFSLPKNQLYDLLRSRVDFEKISMAITILNKCGK